MLNHSQRDRDQRGVRTKARFPEATASSRIFRAFIVRPSTRRIRCLVVEAVSSPQISHMESKSGQLDFSKSATRLSKPRSGAKIPVSEKLNSFSNYVTTLSDHRPGTLTFLSRIIYFQLAFTPLSRLSHPTPSSPTSAIVSRPVPSSPFFFPRLSLRLFSPSRYYPVPLPCSQVILSRSVILRSGTWFAMWLLSMRSSCT